MRTGLLPDDSAEPGPWSESHRSTCRDEDSLLRANVVTFPCLSSVYAKAPEAHEPHGSPCAKLVGEAVEESINGTGDGSLGLCRSEGDGPNELSFGHIQRFSTPRML